jgi:hypothetical protein
MPGDSTSEPAIDPEGETTGLPILRTWPRVYLCVLGCFVTWVGLMFALEKYFS